MFCRNCGKSVFENDKFCSQCGTPVIPPEEEHEKLFKTEEEEKKPSEKQDNNSMEVEEGQDSDVFEDVPKEKFDWNIHTFPGEVPKKTEDINFDWNVGDDEFRNRSKTEEIALVSEENEEEVEHIPFFESTRKARENRDKIESPIEQVEKAEEVVEEREKEDHSQEEPTVEEAPVIKEKIEDVASEPENIPEKSKTEKGLGGFFKLFRPTKPEKEEKLVQEEQTLEEVSSEEEPIEKPLGTPKFQNVVGPKIVTSVPTEEPVAEASADIQPIVEEPVTEEPMIEEKKEETIVGPKIVPVVGPKMWTAPEKEEEPSEETTIVEEDITAEETTLEAEIFGAETVDTNKTLERQTEKIDRFYTFNQKNEEFQKLLDQEYEKFQSGKEPEEKIVDKRDIEDLQVEEQPKSQKEEMAKARELFFTDDIEEEKDEPKKNSKKEEKKEVAEKKEPKKEEEKKETPKKEEDKKEVAKGELNEENSKKEKGEEKKTNPVVAILAIILVALLILLGVRVVAPNSLLAQKTDNVTNKILNMFEGNTETPEQEAPGEEEVSLPSEDKTGIIQLQLDKNTDGIIGTIRYNSSLKYKEDTDYGDADINASKTITDNVWYVDDRDNKHFLDEELVGSVISYEAEQAIANQEAETFNTLDIGEIRKGENGYYVWIAEYKTGSDGSTSTTNKILKIEDNDNTMVVTSESPLY